MPYLDALPKGEYIIVDVETGTIIGADNVRIVKVDGLLEFMNEESIKSWTAIHGAKLRVYMSDLIDVE